MFTSQTVQTLGVSSAALVLVETKNKQHIWRAIQYSVQLQMPPYFH